MIRSERSVRNEHRQVPLPGAGAVCLFFSDSAAGSQVCLMPEAHLLNKESTPAGNLPIAEVRDCLEEVLSSAHRQAHPNVVPGHSTS